MTYTWPIWTHAGADAVGLEETSVDDPDDELWMCCRVIIFYYLSCKQASCVWFIFVAKWQERQMSWDWHLSLSSLSLTTFRSHRVHTARWSIHVTQGSIRMSMCIIYQYIRSDMYQISVRARSCTAYWKRLDILNCYACIQRCICRDILIYNKYLLGKQVKLVTSPAFILCITLH